MNISDDGIEFIRKHEDTRHAAYRDSGGVWTVGVGHTGPEVVRGLKWTDEQIDAALREDLAECEAALEDYCHVPLTQNQYDSLISLIFNIGVGAFKGSTLLRLLNAGNVTGATAQFKRWNKDNGKVVQGLVNRRAAEEALFVRPDRSERARSV